MTRRFTVTSPAALLSLVALALVLTLTLAACGDDAPESGHAAMSGMTTPEETDMQDHYADAGSAPAGIRDAVDPRFPVGTDVTVLADHMDGMEGATGTITGAYSTTTYSVSYTPTDGGAPVTDHRWVVQEELDSPGPAPLPDGTVVTLAADHMPGMKGAEATIDHSTRENVYMVDITGTDGMTMTNHRWVTESELAPAR